MLHFLSTSRSDTRLLWGFHHHQHLLQSLCIILKMFARYHKIGTLTPNDEEMKTIDVEISPFLRHANPRRFCLGYWRVPSHWPWILSTLIFALISLELGLQARGAGALHLWCENNHESRALDSEFGMSLLIPTSY